MGADPSTLAFVGFSGGSSMSNMMHIIHSETIKGAGLMNGLPYSFGYAKPLPDDMLDQVIGFAD